MMSIPTWSSKVPRTRTILFLMSIFYLVSCSSNTPKLVDKPADYVNPFIGTLGEERITDAANTVPGAVRPFGMFNFGPEHSFSDVMKGHRRYQMAAEENLRLPVSPGGYNYASDRLKGFSFTRLSGTGCIGASGDVPILPFVKEITHSPDTDTLDRYYSASFNHEDETAVPGYYQVKIDDQINVELSATDRTGIAKITYPEGENAKLLFRTSYTQLGSGDAYTEYDKQTNTVRGYVTSGNFCGYLGEYNRRDYYTLYFVAQLDLDVKEVGTWENEQVYPGRTQSSGEMPYGDRGIPKLGKGSGLWVEIDTDQKKELIVRVGISYVSVENALENLNVEQSKAIISFAELKKEANDAWNSSLATIQVSEADTSSLTTFYSALYHSFFHPNIFSDVNGEYAGFDDTIHKIEDYQTAQYANFSGWDVYRSQLQLLTLTHPDRASDIAQSLYNQSKQFNGVWDRWTHNSGPTGVMSGDPATIAIANFIAFGADGFDIAGAYESLAKAARIPTSLDLSEEGCPIFCRGQKPSLDQWIDLGYISDESNTWEGASETLEQSSSYFAMSQLAKTLGKEKDASDFLKQSGNWKNLWNPNATDSMGYIQGRMPDGSWKKGFDPYNGGLFVEGSPVQYLWMIPFDGNGLFELMGGDEQASKRLDHFFKKDDGSWALYREGGQYSDVSNQPSINAPWMYLYAGKAYKTQETVRTTMKELWNDSITGIPGQDDLGQMSSWYVFSAMGMYPLYPGRADMVLSSPAFDHIVIHRPSGDITIKSTKDSKDAIYIQSAKLNEAPLDNSWIPSDIMNKGGLLEFNLSQTPNKGWASKKETRPISYN